MWFNHYEAELIIKERVKDALREAEQTRLIRLAEGRSKSRRWRWPVTVTLKGLLAIFTDRRFAEPRRLSLSVTPSPTCKGCPGS
jgi:hypothetical protein